MLVELGLEEGRRRPCRRGVARHRQHPQIRFRLRIHAGKEQEVPIARPIIGPLVCARRWHEYLFLASCARRLLKYAGPPGACGHEGDAVPTRRYASTPFADVEKFAPSRKVPTRSA